MMLHPHRSEIHRIVFAGLDAEPVDRAVRAFLSLPPDEKDAFVARVNTILKGAAAMRFDRTEGPAA